jgi:hypothetical protein
VSEPRVNLNNVGNANDRRSEHEARPNAGSIPVSPKKAAAGASQVSRPGHPLISDHKAPKISSPALRRAHANHNRVENGGADPEGNREVKES